MGSRSKGGVHARNSCHSAAVRGRSPTGLYWKGLVDVQVDVVDISASAEVPQALVARLVQTQLRQRAVAGLAGVLQVSDHGAGILWVDGKVERLLAAV